MNFVVVNVVEQVDQLIIRNTRFPSFVHVFSIVFLESIQHNITTQEREKSVELSEKHWRGRECFSA